MSQWLFEKEDYRPVSNNTAYVDKSINSLLKILSKIKYINTGLKKKSYYFVNPFIKFVFTLVLVIMITYTRNFYSLAYVFGVVLFLLLNIHKNDVLKSVNIGFIAFLGNLVVLLPSILQGQNNSGLIIFKSVLMVLSLNIFIFTTKWNHITRALKFLKIPDIFIFIMDITIKYIVSFAEISLEMLSALKIKMIGHNKNSNHNFGVLGTVFLKSKEQSEELYMAMECRGFTGEYRAFANFSFNKKDYVLTIIYLIFIMGYILVETLVRTA